MSIEEIGILRRRAETFLRYAKEALKHGEFDFACFSSEQAAQLFIKSVMLELTGEVPRLHRVRETLHLLLKSVPETEKSVYKFIEKNREKLRALDDAYITSRYLPSVYTSEDAETLVKLAEDLIEFIDKVLKECRH
ncbi:MAG: HEPN domain-containing protein [Nitrososphaerales archaeon]